MEKNTVKRFLVVLLLAALFLGCTDKMPDISSNKTNLTSPKARETPVIVSEQLKNDSGKTDLPELNNSINPNSIDPVNTTLEEKEMEKLIDDLSEIDSLLNELQELESFNFDI